MYSSDQIETSLALILIETHTGKASQSIKRSRIMSNPPSVHELK